MKTVTRVRIFISQRLSLFSLQTWRTSPVWKFSFHKDFLSFACRRQEEQPRENFHFTCKWSLSRQAGHVLSLASRRDKDYAWENDHFKCKWRVCRFRSWSDFSKDEHRVNLSDHTGIHVPLSAVLGIASLFPHLLGSPSPPLPLRRQLGLIQV